LCPFFFFSSRRRHTRFSRDWSSDVSLPISHLHFDHAGGLLTAWEEGKEPELLFPKATFIIGERHWARARRPHPRDQASFIPQLRSAERRVGKRSRPARRRAGSGPFSGIARA